MPGGMTDFTMVRKEPTPVRHLTPGHQVLLSFSPGHGPQVHRSRAAELFYMHAVRSFYRLQHLQVDGGRCSGGGLTAR